MGWMTGSEPPFFGERNQDTIWEIGRENDKIHPTQKPVRIFEIPMENHTKPGEICLEPFSGSGSQIIAAEKLSRRCFAMEFEPIYVDVAVKRWEEFTGQKAIRGQEISS
jgi:DNA modification methylase